MTAKKSDIFFMKKALALAEKGQRRVSPNPMVGAVIAKNNLILAEGYHQKFGGPHAEINALKKLKNKVKGSTLYVTLEPCYHEGKTPPCVEAVIKSGIKRVVVAMKDPNPLTHGKSILKMRRAGLSVKVGVCEKTAREINRYFIKHITTGMPYVIAKTAQSRDGFISKSPQKQTWLTGRKSFFYVQNLRVEVDAILVGRRTVEIDNPRLNVRKVSRPQPLRVILDSHLKLSPKRKIFTTNGGGVILITVLPQHHNRVRLWQRRGVKVLSVVRQGKKISLKASFKKLAKLGVQSILVEGGAQVLTSLFKEKLIDEWHLLIAPKVLGTGVPIFCEKIHPVLDLIKTQTLGKDTLLIYRHFLPPSC